MMSLSGVRSSCDRFARSSLFSRVASCMRRSRRKRSERRDVLHADGDEVAAVPPVHAAQGNGNLQERPVLAAADRLDQGRSVLEDVCEGVERLVAAIVRDHEQGHGAANRLVRGIAEDGVSRPIPGQHPAIERDGEKGVRRLVYDQVAERTPRA